MLGRRAKIVARSTQRAKMLGTFNATVVLINGSKKLRGDMLTSLPSRTATYQHLSRDVFANLFGALHLTRITLRIKLNWIRIVFVLRALCSEVRVVS